MDTKSVFFGIDDYMARFVSYIKRSEARELAQCYVVGLMMDGERKSVEPMSKRVHASERGMQRLLTEVKWDHEGTFGKYRRLMLAETADPQGVLEMVRLFHERFWIEQGYQQLKEGLGLDHHEGRSWTGWHRHVLLVILAFGYLTLQRIQKKNTYSRACGFRE